MLTKRQKKCPRLEHRFDLFIYLYYLNTCEWCAVWLFGIWHEKLISVLSWLVIIKMSWKTSLSTQFYIKIKQKVCFDYCTVCFRHTRSICYHLNFVIHISIKLIGVKRKALTQDTNMSGRFLQRISDLINLFIRQLEQGDQNIRKMLYDNHKV